MRSKEEALAKPIRGEKFRHGNKTREIESCGIDVLGRLRVVYRQVTVKRISVDARAFKAWATNAEYLGGAE